MVSSFAHQLCDSDKPRNCPFEKIWLEYGRLRVGDDVRVFYDVTAKTVEVLAIVSKAEADAWLEKHGEIDETSSSV